MYLTTCVRHMVGRLDHVGDRCLPLTALQSACAQPDSPHRKLKWTVAFDLSRFRKRHIHCSVGLRDGVPTAQPFRSGCSMRARAALAAPDRRSRTRQLTASDCCGHSSLSLCTFFLPLPLPLQGALEIGLTDGESTTKRFATSRRFGWFDCRFIGFCGPRL